ncbi:N-6 DNA methylase [Variovorax sp. RO1]|uniref:N-6 DNA methylase n=1 Tax=Variovorax sp. RO1 TaxID=2066034 RepID=UPI0015DFF73D|nr:N-6 DNA methylase [Variovorax sp. RO1]
MLIEAKEGAAEVKPQVADALRRRNLGIYYTPMHAATILAKWAIRDVKDFVLEPSFGGCALLSSAVARLSELGSHAPAAQLQGYDVDSQAFSHLRELFPDDEDLRQFTLADFLKVHPQRRTANVILANPPFVAYRQMSSDQRDTIQEWRRLYSGGFSMEAALWLYFLAHSLQFLQEGGRIAFVLPSSYLASNYAAPVRTRLEQLFRTIRVVEVNERLFLSSGAQERTCLLLADNYCPVGWPTATKAIHVACEALQENYLWDDPAELTTDQQAIRSAAQTLLDELGANSKLKPLGHFLHPLIGEVTGDVPFFVKSATEWSELGIMSTELTAVIHGSGTAQRAVIRADDAVDRFMLTPSAGEPNMKVARYLAGYPDALQSRNKTFAKRQPWWRVSCCTTALGFVPSLHNGYFRLMINDAEIACTNSIYRLMPAKTDVNKFAVGLAAMTSIAQLSAELLSRKLGGGALKLEPSDVRRVSLPVSLETLSLDRARRYADDVDKLIRQGLVDEAGQEADRRLLVEPQLISAAECERIRAQLNGLRQMRLGKSRAQSHTN